MRTCIENFCRRPDHRTVDSCVVCLLSHGVEGAIYGTDGQLLQVCFVDSVHNAIQDANPILDIKCVISVFWLIVVGLGVRGL